MVAGPSLDLGHLVWDDPGREPREQLSEEIGEVQLGEHQLCQRVRLKLDTAA